MPRVSVGMPVRNAEATIALALQDLITQSLSDLEILVCDNASTDATAAIADEFARRDPRVRVIRFTERADILHSFRRAYEAATGEYFLFAPADDRWYRTFVADAAAMLDSDPQLAVCCARTAMTSGRRFLYISSGTRPLDGDYRARLRRYFSDPAENGRAFGLWRRAALAGAFPDVWFPGWDFVFTARALAHGRQAELPRVLMERDRTPLANYIAEFDRYYGGKRRRWFPLAPVAGAVWRDRGIPRDPGLLWNLFVFVLRSHVSYAVHRAPRWGRVVARLAQVVRLERWPVSKAPDQSPSARSSGESPSAARSA